MSIYRSDSVLPDVSKVQTVDPGIMRLYSTSVLVKSVTVRRLPAKIGEVSCAVTLKIHESSYTTGPIALHVETGEEVDDILGSDSVRSTLSSAQATTGSIAPVVRESARRLYRLQLDNLNLLFPAQRRTTREVVDGDEAPVAVSNPRLLSIGISVTVHSVDRNHIFGTASCFMSGEAATLSFPRGEALMHFRIFPCAGGKTLFTYQTPNPFSRSALRIEDAKTEGTPPPSAEDDAEEEVNDACSVEGNVASPHGASSSTSEMTSQNQTEFFAAGGATDATRPTEACFSPGSGSGPCWPLVEADEPLLMRTDRVSIFNDLQALIPCCYEEQRAAAFALYDVEKRGCITRDQLLHFCRAHAAYTEVFPGGDEDVLRSLQPYIKSPQNTKVVGRGRLNSPTARRQSAIAELAGGVVIAKPSEFVDDDVRPANAALSTQGFSVDYDTFCLVALKLARM